MTCPAGNRICTSWPYAQARSHQDGRPGWLIEPVEKLVQELNAPMTRSNKNAGKRKSSQRKSRGLSDRHWGSELQDEDGSLLLP